MKISQYFHDFTLVYSKRVRVRNNLLHSVSWQKLYILQVHRITFDLIIVIYFGRDNLNSEQIKIERNADFLSSIHPVF